MISFILPAHNEELWIGKCLDSIRMTMEKLGAAHETIVVNDASTDSTARIAEQMGARVIFVEHRNIAATRNSGAREARGEVLFFVDADTQANERAVSAGLEAIRSGAVGGGCVPEFDRPMPLWGRIVFPVAITIARAIRMVGGCFLFCTRQAFEASGGFPEKLYAAEEVAFIRGLKKVGRFVVPGPSVITSGRKLDVIGPGEVIPLLLRVAIFGPYHETREGLDFLYGKRAQDSKK
jgi:glycosyltransferase involved in cell wall biosynthesis